MVRLPLVFAVLTGLATGLPALAADLTVTVPMARPSQESTDQRRVTLSNFIALELTRVTFDVLTDEEMSDEIERKLVAWAGGAPSEGEQVEIGRQLLAEGSYYLTSLRYLIEAGGAVFPDDRPEASYAGDTLVALDALQRQLEDGVAGGEDVSGVIIAAERIRALTEGHSVQPADFGPLARHAELLEHALERARTGTAL